MTTHKRTGRDARLAAYDIDIYNTLLKAVRGKCRLEFQEIFSSVDGTDNFKFTFDGDDSQFKERCLALIQFYKQDTYKTLGFDWIDNFRQVRDKSVLLELNKMLVDAH